MSRICYVQGLSCLVFVCPGSLIVRAKIQCPERLYRKLLKLGRFRDIHIVHYFYQTNLLLAYFYQICLKRVHLCDLLAIVITLLPNIRVKCDYYDYSFQKKSLWCDALNQNTILHPWHTAKYSNHNAIIVIVIFRKKVYGVMH